MPNFLSLWPMFLAFALIALIGFFLIRKPAVMELEIVNSGTAGNGHDNGELTIAIWNLGYAGLGADSDFIADGGQMTRVPSQQSAQNNLDGILNQVEALNVDVSLLQEVSGASYLNRGVDLKAGLSDRFGTSWFGYIPEIEPELIPRFIRPRLGKAIISDGLPEQAYSHDLPGDGGRILGVIERHYSAQVIIRNNPTGGDWAIINIHLSAFDEGGQARYRQLEAVFELGRSLEAEGYNVVMGGDWNLRLADTNFAHTTEDKDLFWIHDFPEELLPQGWQIVIDPQIPTVRTNERPYQAGENYTTVIDGFIISSGVEVASVDGVSLDFRHADHQPVVARFRARQ